MQLRAALLTLAISACATGAYAEFDKIDHQNEFLSHIAGKTLTRPLVELRVTTDGRIEGRGSLWDVSGNWSWQDGYFCRDLFWGGDALGYNCQEVQVSGPKLRFTSDRGQGQSAVFRLR